jgi:hypothetical protein
VYLATYNDPWYPRSTMAGVRAGLYRTQQFNGGIYAGYRTSYEDVVVGMDGLWDHCPWPNTQLGFNAERRLATAIQGEISPSRGVLFGRYVFQYNSSLYLPPMHYLEAFTTAEENFLPYNRNPVPGSQRFEHMVVGGLHYHINYLTPYWDPQGGFQFDLTYSGGEVKLDRNVGLHQLTGQFSTVKSMPDLSEYLGEENPAGKVLHWFGQTRLAVRAFGAGGIPDRGEYFALGGDPLFRGFSMKERQGSLVWLGSLEWRLPLARHLTWSCIDRVVGVRNLWGAVFYDVGDAYTRGQSAGPVAHALGAGLRIDVTWFGFVERSSLRFDLAKAVNLETPCQFWFGVNMPF